MEVTIGFFVFGLFLCGMAAPPTDRTESCDDEEDEYAQKCGDPTDCETWTYTQSSPCSYDCTCDGIETHVLEDDRTPCGTNKWCIKGKCQQKFGRTEDRTEIDDDGRNKCVEKCGDPEDCNTWTCRHVVPCSYDCSCNGNKTQVDEDDFTPCGTNKWCIEGECEDKRTHKKDLTENYDGRRNKCFEKCGDPRNCRTWTCTQTQPCLYHCTCDGKGKDVFEDDFTSCGRYKWCVNGTCQQKFDRTEDRTEIGDDGINKCVEKCGDPEDCDTWTCRHVVPCSYDCSCNGNKTKVPEDDFTPCGTNKWCIEGECEDKRTHKKDLTENYDGRRNKCFEKCGDPRNCRTWTCTQSQPCSYYCTCDGKGRRVFEDNFTPCGRNKWCIKGKCRQKRSRTEDQPESDDDGGDEYVEKCGDPEDCKTWNYKQAPVVKCSRTVPIKGL